MGPAIKLITDIGLQAALIALFLGSLFTLFVGVALLLGQPWVFRLNEKMKRWISTRQAMRPLEEPRSIETQLYRWHLPIGLLIALGAAFILYVALLQYDAKAVVALFHVRAPVWVELLVQACWWFCVVAALAGLVVGLLLMARPSVLHAADAWANRFYSARRATKPLEVMNFAPDRWIVSSPKVSGGIIVAGSLYVVLVLGHLLVRGV